MACVSPISLPCLQKMSFSQNTHFSYLCKVSDKLREESKSGWLSGFRNGTEVVTVSNLLRIHNKPIFLHDQRKDLTREIKRAVVLLSRGKGLWGWKHHSIHYTNWMSFWGLQMWFQLGCMVSSNSTFIAKACGNLTKQIDNSVRYSSIIQSGFYGGHSD